MSEDTGLSRRRFLAVATGVTGTVGAVATAIPFLSSWQPSARARALGAPVEVDISKLEEGAMMKVIWRGKPVSILKRSSLMLERLEGSTAELRDPDSENPDQQPPYAQNEYRSVKPEILVIISNCTHLGCVPIGDAGDYKGWFCPCHGSHYDTAGRIRLGPAPENLPVPRYEYLSDTKIRIG